MSEENARRYRQDLEEAREKYKDRIRILIGIEQDSLAPEPEYPYQFRIGSVHFLGNDRGLYPVDLDEETFGEMVEAFGGIENVIDAYCSSLEKVIEDEATDIVGHIDLVGKYNEDQKWYRFDDPAILARFERVIEKIAGKGKLSEINTGAMSRGYRSRPYPDEHLLRMMVDHGVRLVLNTDSHQPENLDYGMKEALDIAEKCGVRELYSFDGMDFIPVSIEEWRKGL